MVNARDLAADTASVDPERAALALSAISQRHRNPRHSLRELWNCLLPVTACMTWRTGCEEFCEVGQFMWPTRVVATA